MFKHSLDKKIRLGSVVCFGGGGGGSSQPATAAPAESDSEVQAAKEKERALARLRRGRGATILTSGQGLGDTTTGGKTLLGG